MLAPDACSWVSHTLAQQCHGGHSTPPGKLDPETTLPGPSQTVPWPSAHPGGSAAELSPFWALVSEKQEDKEVDATVDTEGPLCPLPGGSGLKGRAASGAKHASWLVVPASSGAPHRSLPWAPRRLPCRLQPYQVSR